MAKPRSTFRVVVASVIWMAAWLLFLQCALYCVRSAKMERNDLVSCGRYPTAYFNLTLNWRLAAIKLSFYDMAAFRVADPPRYFYARTTGLSMAAATPAADFDSQNRIGWDHLNLTRYYIAGRELHTEYQVNIPYFIPILGALSLAYVALRWPFRKKTKPGHCPTCGYDLRAHKPGDKCPECGIPVPPRFDSPSTRI